MEIVICKTKEEASRKAAAMITAAVKENPKTVLGLATGSTPVAMYKEMIKAVKAKKVSYRRRRSPTGRSAPGISTSIGAFPEPMIRATAISWTRTSSIRSTSRSRIRMS